MVVTSCTAEHDDDVLINIGNTVDIVKHTAENGGFPYLKQRLREVLCQFAKPCGVSCGYNYILHGYTNRAPSSVLQK